jgi:hypothetical protein
LERRITVLTNEELAGIKRTIAVVTEIVDAALAVKAARHGLQEALERLADQGDGNRSLSAAKVRAEVVSEEAQRRLDVLLDEYELLKREARSDG